MKICDLTNFYSPRSGGVKTYINKKREYIDSLGDGYSHLLIVPGAEDSFNTNGTSKTYQIAGHVPFWEKNYRFITNFAKIQELILDESPDVIEIGSPYIMPWAVRRIGRKLGLPLIGFFHSNFPSCYVRRLSRKLFGDQVSAWCEKIAWAYARKVFGICDAVVATSRYAAKELHDNGIRHVEIIPFGIDLAGFNTACRNRSVRDEFGIREDSTLLISVGRISPEKDLETLIRAFEIVRRKGDFSLIIIGSGPNAPEIMKACDRIEGMHYAGYISQDEGLPKYYASADIFVTASPNETFGLSPLEALACGTPVVAVNRGGLPELLSEKVAEIAEAGSAASLADAILALQGRLSPELSRLCRKYVSMRFSWQEFFDKLFALYERVLNHKRHRVAS